MVRAINEMGVTGANTPTRITLSTKNTFRTAVRLRSTFERELDETELEARTGIEPIYEVLQTSA
jgi:hypothetical protein